MTTGQYDNNKPDIFTVDEARKGAFLEDVLSHNARLHVLDKQRYAKCFENVVRVYGEFFKNPREYREAARTDFQACVDAHFDMLKEGLL